MGSRTASLRCQVQIKRLCLISVHMPCSPVPSCAMNYRNEAHGGKATQLSTQETHWPPPTVCLQHTTSRTPGAEPHLDLIDKPKPHALTSASWNNLPAPDLWLQRADAQGGPVLSTAHR